MNKLSSRMIAYHVSEGLRRGGAIGPGRNLGREALWISHGRGGFWWADLIGPQHTCFCGFRLAAHSPGVLRVKALDDACLRSRPGGQWFEGNALLFYNFRELSFAVDEFEQSVIQKEVGYFFARLVRGELHRIQHVDWTNDGEQYPDSGWTVLAAQNYANNQRAADELMRGFK